MNEKTAKQKEEPVKFIDFIKEVRKKAVDTREQKRNEYDKIVRETIENRPLSYSSLKQFAKSPQHYIEYITAERTPPTPAMVLGSIVDVMLFTPNDFEKTYAVSPNYEHDGRTKLGKQERQDFKDAAGDKVVITQEQYDTALAMLESLFADDDAMQYIDRIKYSQSTILWTDPATGLKQISKLDGESDQDEEDYFILDLKSANDAEEDKFKRDAHNFGYHIQAGGYTLGAKRKYRKFPIYINIVVESKAPYAVNVFKASSKYIETSQNEYEYLVLAFKHCLDNNLWHLGHAYWRLGTPYYAMDLPGYFKSKLGY